MPTRDKGLHESETMFVNRTLQGFLRCIGLCGACRQSLPAIFLDRSTLCCNSRGSVSAFSLGAVRSNGTTSLPQTSTNGSERDRQ